MRFDSIRELVFRTISQVGIEYRDSFLSQTHSTLPDGAPLAGDRFPVIELFSQVDDTGFTLILVGQSRDQADIPELRDLLRVHELADAPGIPTASFYLLRPDGHIALTGIHFDPSAVSRYVTEHLRVRSGP
jgi:hypothetical protein